MSAAGLTRHLTSRYPDPLPPVILPVESGVSMAGLASEPDLSPRLTKRLGGRCCYGACGAEPLDGSDYCGPHDAHEKGRDRAKKKRRRARLANRGLCAAGCGRKVGKRKNDGRPIQRRCAQCAKALRARRLIVPGDDAIVPVAPTVAQVKLELGKDGATRTRYVPRPGQGGPSKIETRRSRAKLVADAARLVTVWQQNYDDDTHAAIDAMPRIQRSEAISLRTSAIVRALRLLGLVAEEEDPGLKGTCTGCGRAHADE